MQRDYLRHVEILIPFSASIVPMEVRYIDAELNDIKYIYYEVYGSYKYNII